MSLHAKCSVCGVLSPAIADGQDINACLTAWSWRVHPDALAEARKAIDEGKVVAVRPNLLCNTCVVQIAEGHTPRPKHTVIEHVDA